jgi:acyl carrier protein phosphodiesterase
VNFLAHIFLSGSDDDLLLGGFIADHVKGKALFGYPERVRQGILLHRAIDRFTDTHPQYIRSRTRLKDACGRYAGVIADVFYDHFLSAGWNKYSNLPLRQVTQRVYDLLEANMALLPARTSRMLPFLKDSAWLEAYGTLEGVSAALKGLERRSGYWTSTRAALEELSNHYVSYRGDFEIFFPQAIIYSEKILKSME